MFFSRLQTVDFLPAPALLAILGFTSVCIYNCAALGYPGLNFLQSKYNLWLNNSDISFFAASSSLGVQNVAEIELVYLKRILPLAALGFAGCCLHLNPPKSAPLRQAAHTVTRNLDHNLRTYNQCIDFIPKIITPKISPAKFFQMACGE